MTGPADVTIRARLVQQTARAQTSGGRGPAGVGAPVSDYILGSGLLTAADEAALQAILNVSEGHGTNFTAYRQALGIPDTAAGHRSTLDALMADAAVSVIDFDDGIYSPHWSGTVPAGARKTLRGSAKAILKATARTPIIQCESVPTWVSTVTAITRTTGVNLSQDSAATTSNTVDVLTLGTARAVSAGDRVKVVSNDVIVGSKSDSAGDRRHGEFAVVGLSNSGDTSKITLTAPLRGTYTTGIRVALIPDSALSIEGFTLDADSSLIGTGTTLSQAIRLIGMIGPRVEGLRSVQSLATGVIFAGCLKPLAVGLDLHNHANIPSAVQFGYGVVDASCEGMVIANSQFSWLRHPQDTSTTSCAANDTAIWKYGPSRDLVVANCTGFGCQNGFGTHDEVDGALFIGNYAANFCQGASSGGAAYALRGRNVRLIGNSDDNCRSGVAVSTIEGGQVFGHRSRNARVYGLSATGGTSTEPQDTRARIEQSSFHLKPDSTGSALFLARPTLSATVQSAGSGYTVGDVLTLSGGDFVSAADIKVKTVNGSGGVLTVSVEDPGFYNTPPTNPAAVTGGTGTGATFNCAFKTVYVEFGEGVEFVLESTLDSRRVMDIARARITGCGPTIDITKLAPGGTPDGINVYWQQNYDDTLVRFDAGKGMAIKAGAAKIAALWNAPADGSDTPFTNAHEFPDTYVEADNELTGASSLNPTGIYAARWPNLAWSLVKRIAGITYRSDNIEANPTTAVDLFPSKRLDRRILVRLTTGSTYGGLTLTNIDYTRLPRGAEVVIINASVGNVTLNGLTIPPGQTAGLQFRSNGTLAITSRSWTWPRRISGVRTGNYTTDAAHVGGLQQISSTTAKTITPHATMRVGDRITFENLGSAAWQFTAGGGATLVSPADLTSAPVFTRTGGAGTSCYLECVANADGSSAVCVIGGTVAA